VSTADWVLIATGVWSAFFSKPGSREKRAMDVLLDEDRVALTGPVLAEVLRSHPIEQPAIGIAECRRIDDRARERGGNEEPATGFEDATEVEYGVEQELLGQVRRVISAACPP